MNNRAAHSIIEPQRQTNCSLQSLRLRRSYSEERNVLLVVRGKVLLLFKGRFTVIILELSWLKVEQITESIDNKEEEKKERFHWDYSQQTI